MNIKIIIVIICLMISSCMNYSDNGTNSDNSFIGNYMSKIYDEFNSDNKCWMLPKDINASFQYCMEIKRVNNVVISGKQYKFVELNGIYFENGIAAPDNAPHVASGISGFLVFENKNNIWNLVSKITEFSSQTFGYSGVDDQSFSKFGPDVYGWKISDGGTWMGISYGSLIYIAFSDGELREILKFPISYNADGAGNPKWILKNFDNQLITNYSEYKDGLFQIKLIHQTNIKNKNFDINYDSKKKQYIYPTELPKIDY